MKFALFLGCVIPAREPSYEMSARKVADRLGIELIDLEGSSCCGTIPIESLDFKFSTAIGAYNICLAEEMGYDLITLCSGCFQLLRKVNVTLKEDKELRMEINKILSKVGKEYKGEIIVKNFLEVLYYDIGVEKIKELVSRPLKELKVATYYGCHLLAPSSVLKLDDPISPHLFDDLVDATGAESVPYGYKLQCCGGLLRGISDELGLNFARNKFVSIKEAQADCATTVCPFCFIQFEVGQLEIKSRFKEIYDIPTLHYPQLLGLAMGMGARELGLHTHRIKTDSLIEKIR
jgi:heterodisulfide reductase subunit B